MEGFGGGGNGWVGGLVNRYLMSNRVFTIEMFIIVLYKAHIKSFLVLVFFFQEISRLVPTS
jgi:hypothetical protein